jgi:hypothetical protein
MFCVSSEINLEPPPQVNIFRWSEQFKEPGGVCKKSHLENLELRKPGFNCSSFSLLCVHQEHCVRRKSKRYATPKGQNLRRYWCNHVRDAFSWVWKVAEYTLRYFYGDKRCPYWGLLNVVQPMWESCIFLVKYNNLFFFIIRISSVDT